MNTQLQMGVDKLQLLSKFYIDGCWVEPEESKQVDVINPATEESFAKLALAGIADVNKAVAAAKKAFPAFSKTTREERLEILERVLVVYREYYDKIAEAVSIEMGAPISFAKEEQAYVGQAHLETTIAALKEFEFEYLKGSTRIVREPVGVIAMITPWNWPLNQIVTKVAPAIAAGCTCVLKPSEIAPLSGALFAEVINKAAVPKGVFNLVQGDGPSVGQPLAEHPDTHAVSFTGSTPVGIAISKSAADTVKRVSLELGGNSANIILPDADIDTTVTQGVLAMMANSGQSCDAPARMLVPAEKHDLAVEIAAEAANGLVVDDTTDEATDMGPVVSLAQFQKVQGYIESGIAAGADLVAGGLDRPAGIDKGYFVRPTIFGNVGPELKIFKEEIFGPVLTITPYEDEEHAIRIANDTEYGLAGYVQSGDLDRARRVALELRAGTVNVNYADWDPDSPFGGYKQSGNGRENAEFGIEEFLETKGIVGYGSD